MMQHFLKRHWKLEKENWTFSIGKTEQQQHGLGVTAFSEKILQEHELFSKRIERPQPIRGIGETEFIAHVGRVF